MLTDAGERWYRRMDIYARYHVDDIVGSNEDFEIEDAGEGERVQGG